jgi:hypothetical protein
MPDVVSLPPMDESGKQIPEYPKQILQRRAELTVSRDLRFHTLTRLYILADSLLDSVTANLVFNEIAFLGWSWLQAPGAGVINVAFGSTRENDGLRNLLADLHAHLDAEVPDGDLPNAFLSLVWKRFLAARANEDILVTDSFLELLQNVGDDCAWTRKEYYQRIEA